MVCEWKKERDGFSLVELVLVIAIMAILTGGVLISFGLLRSADTQGAAQSINNGLSEVKSKNMAGQKKTYMNLYKYSNNYYIRFTKDGDAGTDSGKLRTIDSGELGKKIANQNISISFQGSELESGKIYSFTIKKSDGSFGNEYYVTPSGGTSTTNALPSPAKFTVKASNGKGTVREIWMVSNTGRHYVDVL